MQTQTQAAAQSTLGLRYQTTTFDWQNPLFTDLYQLTMAYAEWKAGRHDTSSVFEAFFRKAPFKGTYTVFAGTDEVLAFLKAFKFTEEHLAYLKSIQPNMEDAFFDYLRGLNCDKIKVQGIKDGTIVFAAEPLLRLEGPFALLQLLETPILNLINFSSLVCTNATRMVLAARENVKCVEFGLRRAQGPNGALTASKYAFMGGFIATSNVYAGFLYNIPTAGTCAHSFIMSFESESDIANSRTLAPKNGGEPVDLLDACMRHRQALGWNDTVLKELYAFVSFAVAYPDAFSALVDSYNTMESGVKNMLLVSIVLSELGYKAIGIRLDSGDLVVLSQSARELFAQTGAQCNIDFSHLKIVASNDINEGIIEELTQRNHSIDVFGIGTNLVTCQNQPALGMVYKVCEFKGTPRIKISEEPEKTTIAGAKSVLRAFNTEGRPMFDLLCMREEFAAIIADPSSAVPAVYDRLTTSIAIEQPFSSQAATGFAKLEPLSIDLYTDGEQVIEQQSLQQRQSFVKEQLESFGGYSELIAQKKPYPVYLTPMCYDLQQTLIQKLADHLE